MQRYRENNCSTIPDDKGPYYLVEDVEKLQAVNAELIGVLYGLLRDADTGLADFVMLDRAMEVE